MDTSFLNKANLFFRSKREVNEACTRCDFYREDSLLEIYFPSRDCTHSVNGSCIMCDYGLGMPMIAWSVVDCEMQELMDKCGNNLSTLILCTNGSFFDDQNVPVYFQRKILEKAAKTKAATLIIETHVSTINKDKLSLLQSIAGNKDIRLELGVESANQFVRKHCYNKPIPTSLINDRLRLIKQYNMGILCNTMLGAPFLTAGQQMQDALATAEWSFEREMEVVLFPVNIKPFTLLMHLYRLGYYSPVSFWLIIETLNQIPENKLHMVHLAWFGNRELAYADFDDKAVFPSACPACTQQLLKFCENFNSISKSESRKDLLNQIVQFGRHQCGCYGSILSELQKDVGEPLQQHVFGQLSALKEELIRSGLI